MSSFGYEMHVLLESVLKSYILHFDAALDIARENISNL